MIRVSPSILAADFANLEREIGTIKQAGAEYVHIDVMDGLFVPNISIGLPVLSCIRKVTDLTLDVHLMIDRPVRYAERFCQAGADIVTVHVEADTQENTLEALRIIRACGTTKVVNLASNVAALITYGMSGNVLVDVGIKCTIFSVLGNWVGSGLALKKGAKVVRPIMIVAMLLLLGKIASNMFLA